MNKGIRIDNDIILGDVCRLLSEGKKVKLRAKGNSMRPFIHCDDLLLIEPSVDFQKGDVVFARIGMERFVAHRIIGIKEERFILMGDANLYETEGCRRQEVYGAVRSVIRNGKARSLSSTWIRFLASAWRFILPLRRIKRNTGYFIRYFLKGDNEEKRRINFAQPREGADNRWRKSESN